MQTEFQQPVPSSVLSAHGVDEAAQSSGFPPPAPFFRAGAGAETSTWKSAAGSLGLIALLTTAAVWIAPVIHEANLAILYAVAVMSSAVLWGRGAAILSAIAATVLFAYFFVPPYHSLAIADAWYLITLFGLLAIGLAVSLLAVTAEREARAAILQERHTSSLFALTKSLNEEDQLDRVLDAIVHHVIETFRRPIVFLLPGPADFVVHFRSPELVFDERERSAAARAFVSSEGMEVRESGVRYHPMKTWQGVVGVLGIMSDGTGEPLSRNQEDLLAVFINQAALAITRADVMGKARRAEELQESDRLQKALLNSVSHDLRTPLVSVIGGLNSVIHDAELLDAPTQKALLTTARDEALRLNRVIQNLLDMSRLEGGVVHAKSEPCDVHDVIGAALEQMGDAVYTHPVSIRIQPNLPLVPMDHALIVQVLVNLLDNAVKYSPAGLPIEIEAGQDERNAWIRIVNSGNEIPTNEIERMFDKFFRGASSAGSRGVGLGLSICRGFVEAHHGRIQAERREQGGVAVTFWLPLESHR